MREQCVYGSASDVCAWQNNFLNNPELQVGRECEVDAYTGTRQRLYMAK